jgi:O-antigen/teichoic acid export membrane protein
VIIPGTLQSRAGGLLGLFGRNRLGRQAIWIAAPLAVQMPVRLGSSIILTHLLAPEMFGLMALVNTLRTGTELLSDVGIGQSIVRSPRGEEKRFLDTAFTVQLLRGLLLAVVMLAAAGPIGAIYGKPELTPVLLTISILFVFTGLQSPGLFMAQRHMWLRARAAYDVGCTVFQALFTIALALVMPSVWALGWGLVGGTLFSTAITYAFGRKYWPSLAWDRSAAHEILHFGKWIFLSTMVYFAATSTDNIYFVAALPLAIMGVYGIARTIADLFDQLGQRAGSMLIFPKLAALGEGRREAAGRLRSRRRSVLAVVALGVAAAMGGTDKLILLVYDERYHFAAFMLPLMLAGVWFRVLGSFADAMLMGCGRPGPGAFANSAKFAILIVGLPLAVGYVNLFAALLVLILAEAARWAVLAPVLQRERLATVADDVALTALAAVGAVVFKVVAGAAGVALTFSEWWALGQGLHG